MAAKKILVPVDFTKNEIQNAVFRWPKCNSWLDRHIGALVEVWHVDPCTDGSDDSCGYSFVKVPQRLIDDLKFEAGFERSHEWFLKLPIESIPSTEIANAECLMRGALINVAHVCRVRLTFAQASEYASELLHNPVSNFRHSLCFLPGYHCNNKLENGYERERCAHNLFIAIARILITDARPWYKHPRWHFKHLSIHHIWCRRLLRWINK